MSAGPNGNGIHAVPPIASQTVPPGLMAPAPDPGTAAELTPLQMLQAMAAMIRQMMPPPAQRWQCALCVGISRTWEQANADVLAPLIAQVQAAAAAGQPVADPVALIPPEIRATMPQVAEAVTIATIPGAGLAAVCLGHAPSWDDGPARPSLLLAPGGMDMSAIVRMATGQ